MLLITNSFARLSALSCLAAATLAPASALRLSSSNGRPLLSGEGGRPPVFRQRPSLSAELYTPTNVIGAKRCASPAPHDADMRELQGAESPRALVSPTNVDGKSALPERKRVCRRPSLLFDPKPAPRERDTDDDLELITAALGGGAGGAPRPGLVARAPAAGGSAACGGRDTPSLVVPRVVTGSALEGLGVGMAAAPAGTVRVYNRETNEIEFVPVPSAPRGGSSRRKGGM